MQSYLTELLEWYCDEIAGEAFFEALAQSSDAPARAAKWQMLARLERYVAGRLRSELEARGIVLPAAEIDVRRGQYSALEYADLPWREVLERLRPALNGYVRDFQTAESRMPAELKPLARFVTTHEQALLEFVTSELEDGGHHSLDGALRLLGEATNETSG
jgi:dimethylamine/trimethylamine dehydrogenase